MPKIAIVAALEREVAGLLKNSRRIEREYDGRKFACFEREDEVIVCGGVGVEAARRAAEAVIALYHPLLVWSVGFAGALESNMRVGDIFVPGFLIDARDGSRMEFVGGNGTLLTFMSVADAQQKSRLAQSYAAQAVDMEAAGVAAAARSHGVTFRAIKVISDEMSFEMPEMTHFVDGQGRFRTFHFVAHAALKPWLWPGIARLAHNSKKAAAALQKYLSDQGEAKNISEAKTV